MKEIDKSSEVLSIEDLEELLGPFFGTAIGKSLGKLLFKILKIDTVNEVVSRYAGLRHADFARAALRDPEIDVSYRLYGEVNLRRMQEEKVFITVSNHPFGGIDGLLLVAIVGSLFPDFKVLVNGVLTLIKPLADTWIPVHPMKNKKNYHHDPDKNISGLRMAVEHLKEGHPMGIFPAGGVAHYDYKLHKPKEQIWQLKSTRILKEADLPVFPVMFGGQNSALFYRLMNISYDLNVLRIPAEIFNKKGKEIPVYLGDPIPPSRLKSYSTLAETRDFLMNACMGLIESRR